MMKEDIKMNNIGFFGGGNIAEAIIYGLRKTGNTYSLRVINRSNYERLAMLAEKYEVIPSSVPDLVAHSEVMIIAVKAKDVVEVLRMLSGYELREKLIISVAAGVPLATFEKFLPNVGVVRAMPNTSSAVLYSITGLAKGTHVGETQILLAEEIFKAVGHILWIPESNMNVLTALSGSGPAYFYLFTEYLVQAGVEMGLKESEAELLARETLIGVGKRLVESRKSPGRLREEETSTNGTTSEALSVFGDAGLTRIVMRAVEACTRRGLEMEKEYSG